VGRLTEGDGERLNAGIQELDLKLAIHDGLRLSNQLVQPLFDNRAIAAGVHVRAMRGTWRLAVYRDAEPHRGALPWRSHDEMKVARVKAVHHPAGRTAYDGSLP